MHELDPLLSLSIIVASLCFSLDFLIITVHLASLHLSTFVLHLLLLVILLLLFSFVVHLFVLLILPLSHIHAQLLLILVDKLLLLE